MSIEREGDSVLTRFFHVAALCCPLRFSSVRKNTGISHWIAMCWWVPSHHQQVYILLRVLWERLEFKWTTRPSNSEMGVRSKPWLLRKVSIWIMKPDFQQMTNRKRKQTALTRPGLGTAGSEATSLFCNVAKATAAASDIAEGGRREQRGAMKRQNDSVHLS